MWRIQAVSLLLVTLGLGLLVAVALFLSISITKDKPVDSAVTTLLLAGMGTLVLAALLPVVQSIKLGKDSLAVDFRDLGEDITTEMSTLDARLKRVEADLLALREAPAVAASVSGANRKKAAAAVSNGDARAALFEPGPYRDDPRRGQFGERAQRDGFSLEVSFTGRRDRAWVQIVLTVQADKTAKSAGAAEFFLHDTFRPPNYVVSFEDGKAVLKITAWGGFTVGVWIADTGTKLELDLALAPDAPKVIREL